MGFVQEFKEFAMKGNVVDMAVGIIIGAGFGKIVNSLVNDIIMPPLGYLLGGVDFKDLQLVLKEATSTTAVVAIKYGSFINTLIDFTIVAISIFVMIKVMNRLRAHSESSVKEHVAKLNPLKLNPFKKKEN